MQASTGRLWPCGPDYSPARGGGTGIAAPAERSALDQQKEFPMVLRSSFLRLPAVAGLCVAASLLAAVRRMTGACPAVRAATAAARPAAPAPWGRAVPRRRARAARRAAIRRAAARRRRWGPPAPLAARPALPAAARNDRLRRQFAAGKVQGRPPSGQRLDLHLPPGGQQRPHLGPREAVVDQAPRCRGPRACGSRGRPPAPPCWSPG